MKFFYEAIDRYVWLTLFLDCLYAQYKIYQLFCCRSCTHNNLSLGFVLKVGREGFEPPTSGLKGHCSTN